MASSKTKIPRMLRKYSQECKFQCPLCLNNRKVHILKGKALKRHLANNHKEFCKVTEKFKEISLHAAVDYVYKYIMTTGEAPVDLLQAYKRRHINFFKTDCDNENNDRGEQIKRMQMKK